MPQTYRLFEDTLKYTPGR